MSNLELYSKIPELADASLNGSLDESQAEDIQSIMQDEVLNYEYNEYLQFLIRLQNHGQRRVVKQILSKLKAQHRSRWYKLNKYIDNHRLIFDYASRAAIFLGFAVFTFFLVENKVDKSDAKLQELGKKVDRIDYQQKVENQKDAQKANYSGTAFALDNKGLFLTTNHVVAGGDSIYLVMGNGDVKKADVISSAPDKDIAILKIQDPEFEINDPYPYTIKVSDVDLSSNVYTLSFSKNDKVYNRGYVSSLTGFRGDTTFYQLYLPASEGSSGSPVIDANNNIIGFVSSKNSSESDVTYAVKMKYVEDLIKENEEISNATILQLNKKSKKVNLKDQIDNLNDFIVNVRVYKK